MAKLHADNREQALDKRKGKGEYGRYKKRENVLPNKGISHLLLSIY